MTTKLGLLLFMIAVTASTSHARRIYRLARIVYGSGRMVRLNLSLGILKSLKSLNLYSALRSKKERQWHREVYAVYKIK